MSGNDYVKYVTQQLVSYIDSPKEVRKIKKAEKKFEQPPMVNRWFGIIPLSLMLLFKKRK